MSSQVLTRRCRLADNILQNLGVLRAVRWEDIAKTGFYLFLQRSLEEEQDVQLLDLFFCP